MAVRDDDQPDFDDFGHDDPDFDEQAGLDDEGDRPDLTDVDEPDRAYERYVPRVGPATDPFEDRPLARARALQPLLGGADTPLAAGGRKLLQASGAERIDLVLSLPDPRAAIQAMAAEEFVLMVKDVGLSDAGELLSLASPRQLQACIDLDAWDRDELDAPILADWLLAAQDAGPEVLERLLASQEDGVVALFLSRSLRVFLPEDDVEGEIPDDMEIFASPDGTMRIACDPDDPLLPVARLVIDALHVESIERGRTILRALRWELPSQLEEDLYELRHKRLDDMGFQPRDEALGSYGYRDPFGWRRELHDTLRGTGPVAPATLHPYLAAAGEPPRMGLALRGAADDEAFLARVLASVAAEERQRVQTGLVRLAYLVQSARASRPSQVDELPRWSHHAVRTASMGLEFLSEGDVDYARLLLAQVPLAELFRAGHSVVLLEQFRARRLRTALGGAAGLDLLEPADAALVAALCQAFPAVPAAVPDAAAAEGQTPQAAVRPVDGLAELAAVRRRLQGLAAVVDLVAGLAGGALREAVQGAQELGGAGEVRLATLLNTAIANEIVYHAPGLQPLDEAGVRTLLRTAFAPGGTGRVVRPELRGALTRALLQRPTGSVEDAEVLSAFLDAALDRLADELGGLDPERHIDLRFVGASLLLRV